jgi:hypothetical protein
MRSLLLLRFSPDCSPYHSEAHMHNLVDALIAVRAQPKPAANASFQRAHPSPNGFPCLAAVGPILRQFSASSRRGLAVATACNMLQTPITHLGHP